MGKQVVDKEVDKAVILPPCTEKDFYRLWLTFLTPTHKLTPKNIQIAAELLRHRQALSKVILNENLLMKVLMNNETREEIIKECNISVQNYHVAISNLKKAGFFKDGVINPNLIPKISRKTYNMLIVYTIKDE